MINTIMLLSGLICLILGAEGLVRGGTAIGLRLGLTPLFIGLTIVACGTSAPELVVSVSAALQDKGDISIANVVGSNILNIACILGLTAIITPVSVNLSVIKLDIPVMIAVSIVAFWLINGGTLTRLAGIVLILSLCGYITLTYLLTKKEKNAEADFAIKELVPSSGLSWVKNLGYIFGGIGLMVLGSKLLVDSASIMARLIGVSEAVIGLTVVSLGTSMPELATSVVAALRRKPDVAVGNVVGSNIFNILGILGVSSVVTPLTAPGISTVDLGVMVIAALLLLPLAWTGRILQRWEGGLLLLGYGAYLWWLWPSQIVKPFFNSLVLHRTSSCLQHQLHILHVQNLVN